MISYSYTKSEDISDRLKLIEKLRFELAAEIMPREEEIRARWESLTLKLYFIPALYDLSVRKSVVLKSLIEPSKKGTRFLALKNGFDWIDENWFVSSEEISAYTLVDLYKILWKQKVSINEHEINEQFRYLQSANEHPFIQACIAQSVVFNLKPFKENNEELSHFVFHLFLAKYGYVYRWFPIIEDFFYHERVYFKKLQQDAYAAKDLTVWIEYCLDGWIESCQKAIHGIREQSKTIPLPKLFFTLSARQRKILSFLNFPGREIKNSNVQKLCKVSQITASRELSKLVQLGLLIQEGQGRSVRYKLK